ncbi:MAG: gamma-glutamyl-phosphate reductase, partial [Dictyoglomus thermophilum]
MENLVEKLKKAKESTYVLSLLNTNEKNEALRAIANSIEKNIDKIIKENEKDIKRGEEKGLSKAILDRILLNEKRLKDIVKSIEDVIKLPDPVGEIVSMQKRP